MPETPPPGKPVRTTCPYCGVGCGVIATRQASGAVTIEGDPDHPANFGRLCSKGSALGETVALDDRLLEPEINGRTASWNEALDLVADRFRSTIAEHGPDAVAFYVSGQLLTEDYYVANKLMKGFIGSANIDTNSRLCMASSVAGHKRAFGSDTVPGTYEDLELADLIVLTGSNLAWCHPVLYQRIAAAKEKRPGLKVVLIDPRRTMTADLADLHLAIRPDGDVALFQGLLAYLDRHDALDNDYIDRFTNGFDDALAAARDVSTKDLADHSGLGETELEQFYRLFAETGRAVTVYSQGVNQSVCGTDKVNAILNCHLATGRIGKPGCGPFSVTGQPNAMGGREVGGLANMLAAHMNIEDPAHRAIVQTFWNVPAIADKPGLKAVDLFRAVADGRIKALWIMATNPADTLPVANAVEDAIAACPFVVVSDVAAQTDTLRHAHVKLPSAAWGEKDGTVTNSERRISRQRRFLPLPANARPDWWQMAEVARRMGYTAGFDYDGPASIFREHASLSGFRNDGSRDFDISSLDTVDDAAYDGLQPVQWPAPAEEKARDGRFFANGGFFTPDGRASMIALALPAQSVASADYPYTLNTGRLRDQWHTMTRTGKSARLSGHMAEPHAEISPEDALALGISHASLVTFATPTGSVIVRALISTRQQPGSVFASMHWTDQFASKARIDALIPALTDPHSGQPASKNVPVSLRPFHAKTYGFAVSARRPQTVNADYWASVRCNGGWRTELACLEPVTDAEVYARMLFGTAPEADLVAYHDRQNDSQRVALFANSRLTATLFLADRPVEVSRAWAVDQLGREYAQMADRACVIAGRAGAGRPDPGAIVCSCHSVGVNDITTAIVRGKCTTVAAVGALTGAGTNCGSCRAEISSIIEDNRVIAAK